MASASERPTRVVTVVLGSVAVYFALGAAIYGLYFRISGSIYDPNLQDNLAALKTVFYFSYALHISGSIFGAFLLTKWAGSHLPSVLVAIIIVLAILAYPTLGALSFLNACEDNTSFPISGMSC